MRAVGCVAGYLSDEEMMDEVNHVFEQYRFWEEDGEKPLEVVRAID